MNEITTIILAAGNQTRWNEGNSYPEFPIKQLVDINGLPLIAHTLKQLQKFDVFPTIVTHDPSISLFGTHFYVSDLERKYAVSTLKSTSKLWDSSRIVVLLGDVLYSDEALTDIYKYTGDLHFFGSKGRGEIFAINFTCKERILENIDKVINWSDLNPGRLQGKLWVLYRMLHKIEPTRHVIADNFTLVDAKDFDFQTDYQEYLENKRA